MQNEVDDDRGAIQPGDRVLLIIEDDSIFARILLDLAHEKGFKALVAPTGDEALALAKKTKPDAITLDIHLPDTEGWTVLDRLKHDSSTRHIPVHVLSIEEDRRRGLSLGAFSCLKKSHGSDLYDEAFAKIKKSIKNRVKNLLVVEEHETIRGSIEGLISNQNVHTTVMSHGREAIEAIEAGRFDCIVIDAALPDMTAPELVGSLQSKEARELPIIVFGGGDLSREEETALQRLGRAAGIEAGQDDRQAARRNRAFHAQRGSESAGGQSTHAPAVAAKRRAAGRQQDSDRGRRRRNIFALTSVLERHNLRSCTPKTAAPRSKTAEDSRYRYRADGRDDAGDGRIRNDAGDSPGRKIPFPADHRADGKGDEGGPGEMRSRPAPPITYPNR